MKNTREVCRLEKFYPLNVSDCRLESRNEVSGTGHNLKRLRPGEQKLPIDHEIVLFGCKFICVPLRPLMVAATAGLYASSVCYDSTILAGRYKIIWFVLRDFVVVIAPCNGATRHGCDFPRAARACLGESPVSGCACLGLRKPARVLHKHC